MDREVIQPLNRILLLFQGPAKVIKKRYDKLLDYDNINARIKSLNNNEHVKSVSILTIKLPLWATARILTVRGLMSTAVDILCFY